MIAWLRLMLYRRWLKKHRAAAIVKNIKYGPVAMPSLDRKIKAARRIA